MKEWRVLIIDDEASGKKNTGLERSEAYLFLEQETIAGRPIKVEFAESLGDAGDKIKQGNYQFVLIDVVLQGWGDNVEGDGFETLLLEASKRMPLAVVSSKYDKSSIGIVRRVLNNHSDCDIRLLLTWNDLKEKERRSLIAFQIQNQIYQDKNYNSLAGEQNSIKILHLSDLHFGGDKHTLPNLEKKKIVTKIKGHWGSGPDFIAITGDIANTGHPKDYVLALDWLEWLTSEFGWALPTNRVLLVPGNHDVNIPIAASRNIQVKGEKKVNYKKVTNQTKWGTAAYALAPFQDFAEKVAGKGNWDERPFGHWYDDKYRQYGVIITGINTCGKIDDGAWPVREVALTDLESVEGSIIKTVKDSPSDWLLTILLAHHSPLYYQIEQHVNNTNKVEEYLIDLDLEENLNKPALLVLHGHAHSRNTHIYNGRALAVAAPTPSEQAGRAPDNARGFTLIELGLEYGAVNNATVFSYIYEGKRLINTPKETFSCNNGQWNKFK